MKGLLLKEGEKHCHKPFTAMVVVLSAMMAVEHLLRLLLGWEMTVNGMVVPRGSSGPGLVITAWLELRLWGEART
jgi:hypothetical protein